MASQSSSSYANYSNNVVRRVQYIAYTNEMFDKNVCDRKTKNCLMSKKWWLTNFWKRNMSETHDYLRTNRRKNK